MWRRTDQDGRGEGVKRTDVGKEGIVRTWRRTEENGREEGRTSGRSGVGKDGRGGRRRRRKGRMRGRWEVRKKVSYAIIFERYFQRSISRGFRSIAPPCRQNTPEHIVLDVGEGLTGRDDDRLARVDPQRIHVLHVAHRDAIPRAITHNLRGRSTQ